MRNGQHYLRKTLGALAKALDSSAELIVVDDCSTDDSRLIAEEFGAKVLTTERRLGPAEARNLGVSKANSDILCFVDADCIVEENSIHLMRDYLDANPEISAVFGTYDDSPPNKRWAGRYKNLMLHHLYQNANEDTKIFSTAIGCVRKNAFEAVGGFVEPYPEMPGMQDVDFGYRLSDAGFKIRLLKNVQAAHLKDWTFWQIIRSDIFHRGIPWMKILLSNSKRLENERNLRTSQRLCLLLVGVSLILTIALLIALFIYASPIIVAWIAVGLVACHISIATMNWGLLSLMREKYGMFFFIYSYFLHYVYFINGGISIVAGTTYFLLKRGRTN